MITDRSAEPPAGMPILLAKKEREREGDLTFAHFFDILFICLNRFVLERQVAVNKHSRDCVEVLPVPVKQPRDHLNER